MCLHIWYAIQFDISRLQTGQMISHLRNAANCDFDLGFCRKHIISLRCSFNPAAGVDLHALVKVLVKSVIVLSVQQAKIHMSWLLPGSLSELR